MDVTVMSGPPLLSFTKSPTLNDMMALQTPEIGSYVRLNSGGPPMLVVHHDGPDAIVVSWPDRFGDTHRRTFPIQCVEITTADNIQSSI